MKCCQCGKEINYFDLSSYEWVGGVGGDPIHKECRKAWEADFVRICNMSDEEFIDWLTGKID